MKVMFSDSLLFGFGSGGFTLWTFLEKTLNFKHPHKIQFLRQKHRNKNVQKKFIFETPSSLSPQDKWQPANESGCIRNKDVEVGV